MMSYWSTVVVEAARGWMRHRCARLGAALAYYSVFSVGPLLLIVTAVAGLFFGADAVRSSLSAEYRALLGDTGSQALDAALKGAGPRPAGFVTAATGVLLLVVAAVGVVAQLKDAMNTIWEIEDTRRSGIWSFVRSYLVSLAGILGLGFLLAVSLFVTTAISMLTASLGGAESVAIVALNFVASLVVLSALFAMLFRYFPDTAVPWSCVFVPALATALLFNAGKAAIAWYVGRQGLESTYGAAASIVVLLIWVYYSAQLVLFGAELSRAKAVRDAGTLEPHSRA